MHKDLVKIYDETKNINGSEHVQKFQSMHQENITSNNMKTNKTTSMCIEKEKFTCQKCSEIVHDIESLILHIQEKNHTIKQNYTCNICYLTKPNLKESDLLSHVNSKEHREYRSSYINPELKTFTCQRCNEKLFDIESLKLHIQQRKHTINDNYSCNHCLVTTLVETTLKAHI